MTSASKKRAAGRPLRPHGLARLAARPRLVALVATLISLLAVVGAGRVRLGADLASLLPTNTPAAEAYRAYFEHFGGLELVFVAVEATDATTPSQLVEAAAALETELATRPHLTDVRAGLLEQDEDYFYRYVTPRAPLLMDDADRTALAARLTPAAIRTRVAELHASLATPAGAVRRRWATSDPLGLAVDLPALQGATGLPLDPWTSVFVAPAGDVALVIGTPAGGEMDPASGRALATSLEEACSTVASETGIAFQCRAVGGPLYAAQDEALLKRDLRRTLLGSLVATAFVLLVAFEGWVLPLAALLPLVVGLLWGAGWMGWRSPSINAVSIGFGAVLIGLGVDYAVHLATRFRQSFFALGNARAAMARAIETCGAGIATSAVTTAAGFAVLGLAHLRTLREVGVLVSVGIVAVLASVATVGTALLVAVAPRMRQPGAVWRGLGQLTSRVVGVATRHALAIVVVATVASVAAGWWSLHSSFNPDLRVLRPADPPTRAAESLLTERFGIGLDTAHVLVSGRDEGEALDRAHSATVVLREHLPETAVVSSPSDQLLGTAQRRARLAALRDLPFRDAAETLEQALRDANLAPNAFADGINALRALGRGEDPGAPPAADWPTWLASSVRPGAGHDQAAWVSISVRLPMGIWSNGPPARLTQALTAAVPDASIVASGALGTELRTLAGSDLRRLALWALAAVGTVVLISFRGRLVPSLLALLPVVLGALWTLGAWAAMGRPLDLFCLAVLPILLGIGIDDGLHVMHGAMGEPVDEPAPGSVRQPTAEPSATGPPGAGRMDVARALRGAGRALLLTTVTTAAGFASLLLSDIPGLRNGGALIAVGVSACWLATMLVLPAIATLTRRSGDRHAHSSRTPLSTEHPTPPHAPKGRVMRRLLGPLHVTGVFWFWLHRWAARMLPTWLIGPTVLIFTSFFFVALRQARAAIASNLVPVLGPCGWWQRQVRIYKTLLRFAWCLTERYEQLSTDRAVDAEIVGEDEWQRVVNAPEGFIMVTAHIGHWEAGSMLGANRHVHIVREEEINPRAQAFVRKMFAEQTGDAPYTMHFVHGDPMLGMKLLSSLRRGEIVAAQGDRPRTGGRSLPATLFGQPFSVPMGPPTLARAAGVTLLPVYIFRTGRHQSQVVVRPAIDVPGPGREGLEAAARAIATHVEWAIRHAPHQWFCFRELWPKKDSTADI